jgi:ribosomal 50S subunit-associated protein YjgA (DUF615 family)
MRRDLFFASKNVSVANFGVGLTRSSTNQNDDEDEVLDVVRPEFNNKSLNEIFTLSRQLSDKLLELAQNAEMSIKFKENLITCLSPKKKFTNNLKNKYQKLFPLFKHQALAIN